MAKVFKYILDFQGNTDKIKKDIGGLNSSLKSVGIAAAAAFSIGSIVAYGKAAVDAYDVEAKAQQALLTALKGRVDVQQRLIAQAGELQKKTLYGDEETVRAQSLVAAFVKEEAQIKALIPLIQDMATAKQMDLAGAADLVTKTLAGEMNALGRYGIQVEGAAGSAERLAMIQKGLNDAFGGQAEAAAKVGTAALTQLANSYSDLQETIGRLTIAQQNQQGSFVKLLTNATSGVNSFLSEMATWSDAGFSFSEAFVAAIASSDEETAKLAESLVVVSKTTDNAGTSAKNAAEAYKFQAGTVGFLGEEITKLNEKLATTNATDIRSIAIIGEKIQALEKQKAAIAAIASDPISFRTDKLDTITNQKGYKADYWGKAEDGNKKLDVQVTGSEDVSKWTTQLMSMSAMLDANQQKVDDWKNELVNNAQAVSSAFVDGFGLMGESIVDSLGLAQDGLEGFIGGLASTAMQFIAMMLAKSLAAAIFSAEQMAALTGPGAIFSAPVFIAQAIAGVMGAFAKIPAFASGGIVSGPTLGLMGEYPGASTNPEVIAPLSKLKEMIGGGGGQTIILQPSLELGYDSFRIRLNQVNNNVRKRT